jgi:hypothetical protein
MLSADKLGYVYSKPAACPANVHRVGGFQAVRPKTVYSVSGAAVIAPAGASNPLTLPDAARGSLRSNLFQTGLPARQALTIAGLTYDRPPASLYKVFLVNGTRRALIGTLNFFSTGHTMSGGRMRPDAPGMPVDITFPLRDAATALGLETVQQGQLRLVFVATTGVVGDSQADAERLNTRSDNLHYSAVQLVTDTAQ